MCHYTHERLESDGPRTDTRPTAQQWRAIKRTLGERGEVLTDA